MGLYSLETGHKILDLFKQGKVRENMPCLRRYSVFTHNDSLYACMKYNPDKEVFCSILLLQYRRGKKS